ncbi:MAG TPA: hypothetical protein VK324_17140 [Tepidisphaeraceae bacterium]|nr:hypothetical protein [Tepidisphaeraceae bacterium]
MATLTLTDALHAKAAALAAEAGFDSVEAYVRSLIEADAAAVEQLLLQRLDDPRPAVEVTPEFWDGLRGQVEDQIARRGKAAS